jgi:hypothetical protein
MLELIIRFTAQSAAAPSSSTPFGQLVDRCCRRFCERAVPERGILDFIR